MSNMSVGGPSTPQRFSSTRQTAFLELLDNMTVAHARRDVVAILRPERADVPAAFFLSQLKVNMTPGKIRCSNKGVVLSRGEERVSTRDGERVPYEYLSSAEGLGGFQDHFDWYGLLLVLLYPSVRPPPRLSVLCPSRWVTNHYSVRGGKPLWVDPFDQRVQHIFIDDNIRQNDMDTVVHPKVLFHFCSVLLIVAFGK